MPLTALDLVKDVMKEFGALSQGETPSDGDAQDVLGKINRVLDNWNAERQAVYASQIETFTLTPSLNPHTIGPDGATWDTDQRPVSIDAIVLLSGTVRYVLTPQDKQWYEGLSAPTLTSEIPTDFYYDPDWQNGQVYLYPVPSAASSVEVHSRIVLAQIAALVDEIALPPGYRDAITLTAAEDSAEMFGRPMPPTLPMRATKARARVFRNNVTTPTLDTRDSGLPGGTGWFDYRTGQMR